MNKNDREDLFGLVLGGIGIAIVVALAVWLVVALGKNADKNNHIESVCSYLKADKEGDVCVKDGKIVYTYKSGDEDE